MTANGTSLGLAPADLWSNASEAALNAGEALAQAGQPAIVIDAPARVETDLRSTLPFACVDLQSPRLDFSRPFAAQAIVTAVDVLSGRFFAARVDEREFALDPAIAAAITPEDLGTTPRPTAYVADLRERLGLPWTPAEYLITVFHGERVSNRVRVRVGPSDGFYVDPAVQRYLDEARRVPAAEPVWPVPGDPLPSYRAGPGTPPAPEGAGISLAADRVVAPQAARVLLQGSLRLPVLPRQRTVEGSKATAHPGQRGAVERDGPRFDP